MGIIVDFKLNVKEIRKEKKFTQLQLSELIGISRSRLSEIENGSADLKLGVLYKIGEVLNVCPHALLDYECPVDCALLCKSYNKTQSL